MISYNKLCEKYNHILYTIPEHTSKTLLFVKRWKESPSCIWEIRDRRDGTVEIRSNADVELGTKYYRGKKVVMGKPNLLKESGWILGPVEWYLGLGVILAYAKVEMRFLMNS